MQYRKFGKLDWQASALGLGITGLYSLEEDNVVKIVRSAIDSGVNFIDAGWPFAETNNEALSASLAKAMRDGYRQKTRVAASVPAVKINAPGDFSRALEDLLKWLHADRVDFLMLGGLNRFTWPRLQSLDVLKEMEKALADGKASYPGFFFHDQFMFLRDITGTYDNWAFCQFQYSFMDIDHHPGYVGLKYAADKGLAVVVSKPLLGGRLIKNIPPSVSSVWSNAKPKRSPAEWALRWVWHHPEAATAVCDMDSIEQVQENAVLADDATPESFSVTEELVIAKARDAYEALKPIPCTACRGCMPCPQDIDVPRIFEIFNDVHMYGDADTGRFIYRMERHHLEACNECGSCVCGKNIPIPAWLKKAREMLEENA